MQGNTILLKQSLFKEKLAIKDHARERNKPFYGKTTVSTFANVEVGRLIKKNKKKMKESAFWNFLNVIGTVYFTCFESFNVYI